MNFTVAVALALLCLHECVDGQAVGSAGDVDTTTIGATIAYPSIIESSATAFTASLELAEYTYVGPTVTQTTRTYNGEMVGPTIKIKPGDELTVTLTNSLPEEGFDTSALHNEYRDIQTTNLHVHGLHVSSNEPGDSIFTEVHAGDVYSYIYDIPANHMPGTHWYHPVRDPSPTLVLQSPFSCSRTAHAP